MNRNPSRLLLSLGLGLWLAIAAPVQAEEAEEGGLPRAHWLVALESHPSAHEHASAPETKPEASEAAPAVHPAAETPQRREAPASGEPPASAGMPEPARSPGAEAERRPERAPSLQRSLASIALGLGLMLALVAGTRILLRWDRLD